VNSPLTVFEKSLGANDIVKVEFKLKSLTTNDENNIVGFNMASFSKDFMRIAYPNMSYFKLQLNFPSNTSYVLKNKLESYITLDDYTPQNYYQEKLGFGNIRCKLSNQPYAVNIDCGNNRIVSANCPGNATGIISYNCSTRSYLPFCSLYNTNTSDASCETDTFSSYNVTCKCKSNSLQNIHNIVNLPLYVYSDDFISPFRSIFIPINNSNSNVNSFSPNKEKDDLLYRISAVGIAIGAFSLTVITIAYIYKLKEKKSVISMSPDDLAIEDDIENIFNKQNVDISSFLDMDRLSDDLIEVIELDDIDSSVTSDPSSESDVIDEVRSITDDISLEDIVPTITTIKPFTTFSNTIKPSTLIDDSLSIASKESESESNNRIFTYPKSIKEQFLLGEFNSTHSSKLDDGIDSSLSNRFSQFLSEVNETITDQNTEDYTFSDIYENKEIIYQVNPVNDHVKPSDNSISKSISSSTKDTFSQMESINNKITESINIINTTESYLPQVSDDKSSSFVKTGPKKDIFIESKVKSLPKVLNRIKQHYDEGRGLNVSNGIEIIDKTKKLNISQTQIKIGLNKNSNYFKPMNINRFVQSKKNINKNSLENRPKFNLLPNKSTASLIPDYLATPSYQSNVAVASKTNKSSNEFHSYSLDNKSLEYRPQFSLLSIKNAMPLSIPDYQKPTSSYKSKMTPASKTNKLTNESRSYSVDNKSLENRPKFNLLSNKNAMPLSIPDYQKPTPSYQSNVAVASKTNKLTNESRSYSVGNKSLENRPQFNLLPNKNAMPLSIPDYLATPSYQSKIPPESLVRNLRSKSASLPKTQA